MTTSAIPVFDGHNDTLLRLVQADDKGERLDFLEGGQDLHISLEKARAGRFAGGLFAMFTPNPEGGSVSRPSMGEPIGRERAARFTDAMMARGDLLVERSEGAVRVCLSAADIRAAMAADAVALVYHIEGVEVIDAEFEALEALYARGLRSVGIVWSRNNIFGNGVPFTFPGTPDFGGGLTDLGKELVRRCNTLGVAIDLSHLNEKGFWDVAKVSEKPLIASHSNVHALCPTPRNLTDKQLDAICETGGLVGLNFACGFLRDDGDHGRSDTPLETMIRHLDYLVERLGEDSVGIGSDFDGCTVPKAIGDAAGLQVLITAMLEAGFGRELTEKIAHRNWLGVLERSWGG